MAQTLTYTTQDAIMRRLQGRLEIYQTTLGKASIDPQLLMQLATQAEARLNTVLEQVYKLPLKTPDRPVLAEYVEHRTICELMPVYFQRQNPTDDRSIGSHSCREAEKLLAQLSTGQIALKGEVQLAASEQGIGGSTRVTLRTTGKAERIEF